MSRLFLPWSRVVAGLFIVSSLLPIAIGISTYRNAQVGEGEAVAEGVVVGNESRTDTNGAGQGTIDYFAEIEYTVDGQTFKAEDLTGSSSPNTLGKTYEIIYDIDDPATSRVTYPGAWIFTLGMAIASIGTGLLILWGAPKWVNFSNSKRHG